MNRKARNADYYHLVMKLPSRGPFNLKPSFRVNMQIYILDFLGTKTIKTGAEMAIAGTTACLPPTQAHLSNTSISYTQQ